MHGPLYLLITAGLIAAQGTNETISKCETTTPIAIKEERLIEWLDDVMTSTCVMTFSGELTEHCHGLCYQFHPNTFIRAADVTISISSANSSTVFNSSLPVPLTPQCGLDPEMTFTLLLSSQYEVEKKDPGFFISLEIYNRCGPRGSIKNMKFAEVLEYILGYHQTDEFISREKSVLTTGIAVGFGLSIVFLVIFLAARCYTRRYPSLERNRFKTEGDHHALVENMVLPSPERAKTPPVEQQATRTNDPESPNGVSSPGTLVSNGHGPTFTELSDVSAQATNGKDAQTNGHESAQL